MDTLAALILGIIQGLTEFLPVSSSGHLELAKALFGEDKIPKESLLFTVVVHAATALSTIIVYRKVILDLLRGLFKFERNEETLYVGKIVLSMIPVFFVGVFLEDKLASLFDGRVTLVGCMLLVTGVLLWLTHVVGKRAISTPKGQQQGDSQQDNADQGNDKVTFKRALIIGVAQAIAVLPGISRSGSTIATSLLMGVDKERAARFSFLMVLPPILGAALLKTKDYLELPAQEQVMEPLSLGIGFIAAFLAGLAACTWMIAIVKKSKLTYFAIYCLVVGIAAIVWGFLR